MEGAGKHEGPSADRDQGVLVPVTPALLLLPGTRRQIHKCLLNWISPTAVQQNQLNPWEQQANGLITHCFRTK